MQAPSTTIAEIESKDDDHPVQHFAAGAIAGIFSDFTVHPIDTLRARLQAQREAIYKGAGDAFIKTVKNEGARALYKGFGIVAIGTTPAHALYFMAYEACKRRFQSDKPLDGKSLWVYFVSGFFADCVGLSMWLPMDLVKQRLQVQQNNLKIVYKNSFHAIKTIAREEGVRGLYRGGIVAALTCYGAFYFPLYETAKMELAIWKKDNIDDLSLIDQLSCGLAAGSVAAAVTCPMDVIKTQMQVYSIKQGGQRNGFLTAKYLFQQKGFRVFVAGLGPRIVWIGGGTALTMGAYEQCKKIIAWTSSKFGSSLSRRV